MGMVYRAWAGRCLSSVELATLAGPHDVGGVSDRGGPVKTLSKRITHEGARRGVVTASASVDVTDQLLALGDGDASLQDRALMVRVWLTEPLW